MLIVNIDFNGILILSAPYAKLATRISNDKHVINITSPKSKIKSPHYSIFNSKKNVIKI